MSFGTDTSEESEFLRGATLAISHFSTDELIQELTKREGVSSFRCNESLLFYDIENDDTLILVVRP